MDKKSCLFIAELLLLFGLSTMVLAADSCQDYSGDAKNICNSVTNAKTDFYKKYSMDAANPVQNQLTGSCNNLNGIEKDTCITKNNFVDQHVLTKPANSAPAPAPATVAAPKPQAAMQETPPTNSNAQNSEEAIEQSPVSKKNSKVNIFNN